MKFKSKLLLKQPGHILKEIKEIKLAFKNIELIKAGKLKTRSVEELLRELD